jgi:hypothetical protein
LSLDPSAIEAAKREVSASLNLLPPLEILAWKKIPPVLYHYTSAGGLRGIIESRALWATNVLYLNDSSELSYATALVKRIFDGESTKHTGCTRYLLSFLIPTLIETMPTDFFVACFCENPDLLSQWRAYASKGTGYCLGFETKHCIQSTGVADHIVQFQKVEYDISQQENMLRQRLEVILKTVVPLFSNINPDDSTIPLLQAFAVAVVDHLSTLLTSLKHPAFAEEQEWRIVNFGLRPTPQLRFRSGATGLVPYVELRFPSAPFPVPLTEIRHGPASNPTLTKRSIEDLLLTYAYMDVAVKGSDIPLRDA